MTKAVPTIVRKSLPVVAIAAIILVMAYGGITAEQPERGPLPFDPLDQAEQENALQIALADDEIAQLLDRFEPIGAALNTDKHRLKAHPEARMADVWIYDYTTDQTILALVDLLEDRVDSWQIVPYQPPLTAREADHAAQLALQHPEVVHALQARSLGQETEPTARLWNEAAPHACATQRCALIGFFLDDTFQSDLYALVNLSQDEATGQHTPGRLTHEEVHA